MSDEKVNAQMVPKLTPDEAFDRDIPQALRDDVMTQMAEAADAGEGSHGPVYILEQDRHDAINVTVSGIYKLEDREFWFLLENGNRSGTTLRGWEDAGQQEMSRSEPTQWTLVPKPDVIADAMMAGRGTVLVQVWDAFLARKNIKDIPGKYAYDKYFAPGSKTETYWRDEAAKYKLDISTKEHADEIRARLLAD